MTTPKKRGRGADSAQTKADLVDAAFEALRVDGFAATTTRSVAQRAGCNQAAIYYHFGGTNELFLEALRESSDRRLQRYRDALDGVDDLVTIVDVVEQQHDIDQSTGYLAVYTELVGAVLSEPELRDPIAEISAPSEAFVEESIRHVLTLTPFGALLPASEITDLIFSITIGMQLRSRVDRATDRPQRAFQLARLAAQLVPPRR